MRDLKFRCWHREEKVMYWFDLLWGNQYNMGGGYVGMLPIDQEKIVYQFYRPDSRIAIDPSNCDIMQYTGLKDRNGKEIWEGDIVRYTNKYLDHPVTFEVRYGAGAFWQHGEDGDDIWCEWDELEVIGNIYENPDLLKEAP